MSQLDQYKALANTDRAAATLSAILVALVANQLDTGSRKILAQLILDDIKALLLDDTVSRLSNDDVPRAFSTLKSLGGMKEVASILGTPSNLRSLLHLFPKVDSAPHNDALRCIANTVLLSESARATFVGPEVDGGRVCIELLQESSMEHVFLASRILFLCTAAASFAASFIQWLVEHERPDMPGSSTAVDIVGAKLDDLIELWKDGNAIAKDAMVDLLKLIFNICVHYPKIVDCDIQSPEVTSSDNDDKVMGDYWSSRLDNLLPPLLRAFHASPPSSVPLDAPLPHVIHSLITVPVLPSNRNIWFGTQSSASVPQLQDAAQRAYELLDATLAYFMPGNLNSDDPSIRNRLPDEETLDDLVSPLVILITRFCLGDEETKVRLRDWFIPPDLDRSEPLETRSDLLGRCLRLLQSIYHSRLNRVCGEMFFAMCDCDATTMSGYLGYGNVAGFLFQKGVVSAPPRLNTLGAPTTTATGLPINPITGTIEREHESIAMTDEEKEQEAEKLFVLFERLEKIGAMAPDQNPMRRAIQEGKIGQ